MGFQRDATPLLPDGSQAYILTPERFQTLNPDHSSTQ
jgi:hypothetical protein